MDGRLLVDAKHAVVAVTKTVFVIAIGMRATHLLAHRRLQETLDVAQEHAAVHVHRRRLPTRVRGHDKVCHSEVLLALVQAERHHEERDGLAKSSHQGAKVLLFAEFEALGYITFKNRVYFSSNPSKPIKVRQNYFSLLGFDEF